MLGLRSLIPITHQIQSAAGKRWLTCYVIIHRQGIQPWYLFTVDDAARRSENTGLQTRENVRQKSAYRGAGRPIQANPKTLLDRYICIFVKLVPKWSLQQLPLIVLKKNKGKGSTDLFFMDWLWLQFKWSQIFLRQLLKTNYSQLSVESVELVAPFHVTY